MISHNGKRIPWLRVLLEGVVIVVSILLALGAEAWWQDRLNRSEERELLSSLRDEFVANETLLRAQADSIGEAISVLQGVIEMTAPELMATLGADSAGVIAQTVQRPWTAEFRVGVLDGTLGTERASLIQSHEITSALAEYQAVRHELREIGGLLASVAVQSFISFGGLPASYDELIPLLSAKVGYWTAYKRYLERFIGQTEEITSMLGEELER